MLEHFYLAARLFVCVMCVFTLVVCYDRKLVGFEMTWAGRSWILIQFGLISLYAPAVIRDDSPFKNNHWYSNEYTASTAVAIIAVAVLMQLVARSPDHNRNRVLISALGVWLSFSFVVVFL